MSYQRFLQMFCVCSIKRYYRCCTCVPSDVSHVTQEKLLPVFHLCPIRSYYGCFTNVSSIDVANISHVSHLRLLPMFHMCCIRSCSTYLTCVSPESYYICLTFISKVFWQIYDAWTIMRANHICLHYSLFV